MMRMIMIMMMMMQAHNLHRRRIDRKGVDTRRETQWDVKRQ